MNVLSQPTLMKYETFCKYLDLEYSVLPYVFYSRRSPFYTIYSLYDVHENFQGLQLKKQTITI